MAASSSLRAVLFDWDGTLLDSYHADTHAFLGMFHALGIPWTVKDLERHYSPDWHRMYRAASLPKSRWAEADRLWSRFYRRQRPELMPGARRVVGQLARRYTLGLVTSGNRRRVSRQLRHFGLSKLFAARVCCEDAPRRKPHPAPLKVALERLRLEPEACVYVGDSPEDMEMARRAGVRAIAVLGNFPTHNGLRAARPAAVLDSLARLPRLLKTWACSFRAELR